jgi:signal peptidase I
LPGFTSVKRNDVVVFNWPSEFDYPVDLKTNYIKRAVAVAGDVIEIRDTQVVINGEQNPNPENMQFSYDVITSRALSADFFEEYGVNQDSFIPFSNSTGYMVFATEETVMRLEKSPAISSITKRTDRKEFGDPRVFPDGAYFGWNKDHYGPLEVPSAGWTITLDKDNIAKYGYTIQKYEGIASVTIQDNQLYIDGQVADTYTFKQDYYFMMGDNRHDSLDSRYWGFVPEDHIVGKAWFLWLSLDKHESMFNKIRWSRFLNPIR